MSLTIGHVSLHSCCRAHKIAWTWSDKYKGKIILLSEMMDNHHHTWWAYDACVKLYRDEKGIYQPWQFENAVKTIEPIIDVWHVHNEPDWPVWVIRKHSEKPIIYDLHDLKSIRNGEVDEHEEKAFKACNGVSAVSRRYCEIAIKNDPLKPVREVLSCVPEGFFPKDRVKPFRGGIVYEGGLGLKGKVDEFPCRTWGDVMDEITGLGIQTWAYTANPTVRCLGNTIVMGPVNYARLVEELTMYEFGLVGSPEPDKMFDGALPNKLFEYMAAGIPMICMNAPDAGGFLEATGMGVVVKSVKDIPQAMEKMRDERYRRCVWEKRHNWNMESQIHKVNWLYEQVMGNK